jgi:hypothetical protein
MRYSIVNLTVKVKEMFMPRELSLGRKGLEMGGYAEPRGTHPPSRGYGRRDLADMHEMSSDFASAEVQLWCELAEDQSTLGTPFRG